MRSLRAAVSFLTVLPVANADGGAGTRLGRAYFPAIGALVGLVADTAGLAQRYAEDALFVRFDGTATGRDEIKQLFDDYLAENPTIKQIDNVQISGDVLVYQAEEYLDGKLLQTAALAAMAPGRALVALVVAGAMSRLAAALVIAWLPYVRSTGLGTAASTSSGRGIDLAAGLATVLLVALLDWRRALVALALVAVAVVLVAGLARRRLGGVTGDVCGASAELSQLAVLLVFATR